MKKLENLVNSGRDLLPKQVSLIRKAAILGEKLQTTHPEIAEMYRGGKTQAQIAQEINLLNDYNANESFARLAVGCALRGHEGGFRTHSYQGLLETEELEKILLDRKKASGHSTGSRMRDEKRGAHSIKPEERRRISKKAGKRSYELGVGAFALTEQEKKAGRTRGGYRSALARGLVPWKERKFLETYTRLSEFECAQMMSRSPLYHRKEGVNNEKIASELNKIYHEGKQVRSVKSISGKLFSYRKNILKSGN